MKKPSTLLRSLSTRLSARLAPPSPAVAPWPPVRSAYDRWLSAELDELRAGAAPCTSAAWLARALALAVAAQRRLAASASTSAPDIDRRTIEDCVEDTAELLDALAGLRGRLDLVRGYASSMRVALHWLEGAAGGAATARQRASAALAECEAVERRCGAELAKCGSSLRRLGDRAGKQRPAAPLAGARAAALLAVGALGAALSFRPRRAAPGIGIGSGAGIGKGGSWEQAMQEAQRHVREEYERRRKEGVPCLAELEAAAADARTVKLALAAMAVGGGRRLPDRATLEAARRRCDELEEKASVLEEGVVEMRRELIGVRMVLLEWSQRARGHEVLRL